jgi:small basic protein (TIGR04137 family)
MSIHRSFKSASSMKRHRNVLKRLERIKKLSTDEKWDPEKDSVYGLPKVRSIKIRAKSKSKAAPEEEEKKK